MLWYKSWLETRSRFLIGLVLMLLSAGSTVLVYPEVVKLLPLVAADRGGIIGREVAESAELARTFRGYVWSEWFGQNLPQLWTLFAVLLGTGGLLAQAAGGGALFTLSLPVSRNRLLGVRVAAVLAQLLLLAVLPSIALPLLSRAIGETYGIGDALVHAACLFIGGSVFFALTSLLSTVFSDIWRPPLIALCAAFVLSVAEQLLGDLPRFGVFSVMSAETYFRAGTVPWLGLLISAAVSGAAFYGAARNMARLDF